MSVLSLVTFACSSAILSAAFFARSLVRRCSSARVRMITGPPSSASSNAGAAVAAGARRGTPRRTGADERRSPAERSIASPVLSIVGGHRGGMTEMYSSSTTYYIIDRSLRNATCDGEQGKKKQKSSQSPLLKVLLHIYRILLW